jgi:hypothetical protein
MTTRGTTPVKPLSGSQARMWGTATADTDPQTPMSSLTSSLLAGGVAVISVYLRGKR